MNCFIKNRKGLKMAVVVEAPEHPKALAFVMHGLGGFKEQPHVTTFADAFKERGFTVVRFDTTNTLGESEGKYEDATITSYYEDLEDVITWAETQPWYLEPFWLAGHSLGGICIALYAQRHPKRVAGIAPISPVISGKLSYEVKAEDPEEFEKWKETGWLVTASVSKPGMTKRLPWSHMVDRLKYDLLPEANKLVMPTLFIVGEGDEGIPPKHVRILYDAVAGPKEMHVIKDAPHTFRDPKHLAEIKTIFLKWIDANLKK